MNGSQQERMKECLSNSKEIYQQPADRKKINVEEGEPLALSGIALLLSRSSSVLVLLLLLVVSH